jgi:hypothetical protein
VKFRFLITLFFLLTFFAFAVDAHAQESTEEPQLGLEVTEAASDVVEPPVIVVQPTATPAAPSWDDVLTKIFLGLAVLGLIFSDPPTIRRGIKDVEQRVQATKTPIDDLAFQMLKPYAEQVANVSEQLKSVQADLKTLLPPAFQDDGVAKS